MPGPYDATPLFQNGRLTDVAVRQDGKTRHLWGRGGPEAERSFVLKALQAHGLPVFLGGGLGVGIEAALAVGRAPLAVVDRETPILAATGCRERFAADPRVLWLDQGEPSGILERLRAWSRDNGAPLLPVAPPFYQRLDRAFYGGLLQALERPAGGDFFARMAYAKFRNALPRVLVLGSRYFIMGEVLNALTALGAPFRLFDLHARREEADYGRDLLTAIAEFRPDMLFTVNHFGFDRGGTLANLLERLRLPAASWFVDNAALNLALFEQARSPWTLICAHDSDDAERLEAQGFPHVLRLPLATDPTIFHPGAPHRPGWDFDASFVGDSKAVLVGERLKTGRFPRPLLLGYRHAAETFLESPDGDVRRHLEIRHPDLAAQVDALPEPDRRMWFESLVLREAGRLYRLRCLRGLLPLRPAVAGDRHWRRALGDAPGWTWLGRLDYYEDLPALYRASRVNFNCTSAQMKGAPNQRIFDVPACGGFLLTDMREQVAALFEPEREVVFFREPGEIAELARRWLAEEPARLRVARAARARILAEHTYAHRLRTLFTAMRRIFA
ncbi:MAG TPA: glycosyltransferase [Desulfovibrio sp.]|jgi:spore maturation protein CgeB|uniref:CgeB family protein n=1 Tax=Desulfovibrio sp. TaxID=885 RepID=UPI002BD77491|nr:glycosyltransferase [Desulfovibrio sp.]HMM38103.1 glycosyltransferase [Desulfovibrio sp.]